MSNFAVISDSACDLPTDLKQRHGVGIVNFKCSFDKIHRLTEGADLTLEEFYRRIAEGGAMPKTYFPTVRDYVDEFTKYLEQGRDVLCLCMSSKLSKSYVSAQNAKKILSYTYPDNKIFVLDTLACSAGQSLMVLQAVNLSANRDVSAAFNELEANKKNLRTFFTVKTLDQLARGGRLSATAAVFGSLLKINPIICLEDGALVSKSKAFGRSAALELLKKMSASEVGGKPDSYDFALVHSRSLPEANAVASDIKSGYGITQTIPPVELGFTIGMHTGATVVGAMLLKKL